MGNFYKTKTTEAQKPFGKPRIVRNPQVTVTQLKAVPPWVWRSHAFTVRSIKCKARQSPHFLARDSEQTQRLVCASVKGHGHEARLRKPMAVAWGCLLIPCWALAWALSLHKVWNRRWVLSPFLGDKTQALERLSNPPGVLKKPELKAFVFDPYAQSHLWGNKTTRCINSAQPPKAIYSRMVFLSLPCTGRLTVAQPFLACVDTSG